MDKVSIIIGLYNVADYLKSKQLGCILSQSYRNLEVILVNDGSTDDTLEICEQLASQDDRIVIVSKTNGGLGSARNAGLDAAIGDYIWFYDVDDDADTTLIQRNVELMDRYGVDLIVFGFKAVTPHLQLYDEVKFASRLIDNNAVLKSIYVDELLLVKHGNGFAWNKFYRKSFIDKYSIRFGDQRIQQDELFNLQLYPLLNRVYLSSDILYTYYIYDKGVTRCQYIKNRFDIYLDVFNAFKKFAEKWHLEDKRFETYIYQRFYSGIENAILYNTFHNASKLSLSEKKSVIYNILSNQDTKECLRYTASNNRFNPEQRLYYYAYRYKSFISIIWLRSLSTFLRRVKTICLSTIR
jgi:glycosyltransferase involved in cell wall biosynthesis